MIFPKLTPQPEREKFSLDRIPADWFTPGGDGPEIRPAESVPNEVWGNAAFKSEMIRFFAEAFCRESPVDLRNLILTLEKNIILHVLARTHGNQKEAAKILGLNHTTLNEKMKRYRIRTERKASIFAF